MKPQIVAAQQAEETEQQLVERAKSATESAAWEIGYCADQWTERYAAGRTDADFAKLIGSSQPSVSRYRRIWDRFGDVYSALNNLKPGHFIAALDWGDADTWLQWAQQNEASVREMEATRRLERGESSPKGAKDLGTTEDAEGSGDGQVVPGDGRPVSQLESPQAATQKVRRTDRNENGRNSPGGAAARQASGPPANRRPETAPTASRESRPVSEDETADAQNALQGITEACGTLLVALKDMAARKQAASVLRQTADALDPLN